VSGAGNTAGYAPRDLAARLVVGLAGPEPTAAEWAWLAHHRPAGVILFARNVTGPEQLAALCAGLRAAVPGLEVMADHEGGPVAQLAAAAGRPPAAWALGALDDPELTRAVCRQTGERLRALGLTRVLGPVADVLTCARNPVIGARAFGAEADLCARHAAAAVTGYREAGLRVCVKHWPGHGGTGTDSHLVAEPAPVEGCPGPFRAALAAGADAVMVGHLPVRPVPGTGASGASGAATPQLATLDAAYLRATRTSLAAGDREPLLVADDVTMGALRGPLRALGVPVPDDRPDGLVEPGALPVAWLGALLAAGCERLLIRGIPWRALPGPDVGDGVAGTAGAATPAGPARTGGGAAPLAPDPPAWRAARGRLWAREAAGWNAPAAELAWLDFTEGDRWGAADQRGGAAFAARLAGLFGDVTRLACDGDGRALPDRLLVTSHRPLPAGALAGLRGPARGVALAMGHPSLTADLTAWLGVGWRIGQLYDCDAADLAPEPERGAQ
jgi:hypothetical protein